MPRGPATSPIRPGPDGQQYAALGGQGISIISYSQNQEESFKFLEWFVREDVQKKWGELGGYTCHAAVLESEEFRTATPFNQAFYESMQIVKDFWATPEYAELLIQMNNRLHPYIIGARAPPGSPRRADGRLEGDVRELQPLPVGGLTKQDRRGRAPPVQ
jgi:ABC-type glycerol-3-phosphate transport system substrate-binding protein